MVTKRLQLVLQHPRKRQLDNSTKLQHETHEALVELGKGTRSINLETLSFLRIRHCVEI